MASLYIAEYSAISPTTEGGSAQVARGAPVAEQKVSIGGASTASAAFNVETRFVRLHTDAICSIKFGGSPVADATNMRLAADQTEYFGVTPTGKVAVITNT